ncbi:MAG: RNA methyltransferase [Vampirovibrionales bacterium]|nr:RNA methyltransferase [Vampirovibrionales bacterium]
MTLLPAEILSPAHPRVKAVASLNQKKAREEQKTLLVEGRFPIEEAIRAGCRVTALYRLTESPLPEALAAGTSVFTVSEAAMRKMATTESPPPCLATVETPPTASLEALPVGDVLLLALDEIRDPGNAGTLIRSAAAFGVQALILTPRTVDCYSPKVIRASAGLAFRLPIHLAPSLEALAATLAVRKASLLLTRGQDAPNAMNEATPTAHYRDASYRGCVAIALGNEGRGILQGEASDGALLSGAQWIRIPMAADVDSLNVAVCGSILMAEAAYQRATKTHSPERASE